MPPTAAADEIIEKKSSSPIATSCLIVATVALLGAIVLQVAEIGVYRKGAVAQDKFPGAKTAKSELNTFKAKVDEIIQRAGPAAQGGEGTEPAGDDARPVGDEVKDDATEATDEAPDAADEAKDEAKDTPDTDAAGEPPAADDAGEN